MTEDKRTGTCEMQELRTDRKHARSSRLTYAATSSAAVCGKLYTVPPAGVTQV